MISPIVRGRVESGKFKPNDPKVFSTAFFCHEGHEVEFQPKRFKKVRSLNQNKFYFGVVVPAIGSAMGEDDIEAVHAMLKFELNYYVAVIGKKEVRIPLSTSDLTTDEFEKYLEKVRRWASEFLSLYVQTPNEVN